MRCRISSMVRSPLLVVAMFPPFVTNAVTGIPYPPKLR